MKTLKYSIAILFTVLFAGLIINGVSGNDPSLTTLPLATVCCLLATGGWMVVIVHNGFTPKEGNKGKETPATRDWVDKMLGVKLANAVRRLPSMEDYHTYTGNVSFRGKVYTLSIKKAGLYGYKTMDGKKVEHDRSNVMLTGEVWIDDKHIAQTREAVHVAEVVADIQAVLNSREHLGGKLLLQVRTQVYRYINDEDVKAGWPAALRGNYKRWIESGVKNFDMEAVRH